MSEQPQDELADVPVRAPLGPPAEAEVPRHDADASRPRAGVVEETLAYEHAVEDGRAMPPGEHDAGGGAQGDVGPLFRAPEKPPRRRS